MNPRVRLLVTMGDVAGIGPEIIAAAWSDLNELCHPIVVGDLSWMQRAVRLRDLALTVTSVDSVAPVQPSTKTIPILQGTLHKLDAVPIGMVSAAAGRAAYDFLSRAIDETVAGKAQGIVTAPLHKEALHAAGISFPGHTEILAERTKTRRFGMMLHGKGISVIHVTLHVALRDVFAQLNAEAILEKIRLLDELLPRLLERRPRIGVAGLNPHAGDGGLFGDEEGKIIRPAVESAQSQGIHVSGPWPCDTLFVRAARGEFDGLVVLYHDQGHIAMKLLAGHHAVNVSVGLPFVRTSVAHGTAYDIAGKGIADPRSLIEAARLAALLAGGAASKTGQGQRSREEK
jgi:4-hydroxythreonine-4-phosphate dehydrogenase